MTPEEKKTWTDYYASAPSPSTRLNCAWRNDPVQFSFLRSHASSTRPGPSRIGETMLLRISSEPGSLSTLRSRNKSPCDWRLSAGFLQDSDSWHSRHGSWRAASCWKLSTLPRWHRASTFARWGALWPTTSRKGCSYRFSSHWMDLSMTTSVAYPGKRFVWRCRPAK